MAAMMTAAEEEVGLMVPALELTGPCLMGVVPNRGIGKAM